MSDRKYSTGVGYLDELLGGLLPGDNVVWQADSGAPVEFFTKRFLSEAIRTDSSIIFVSFNHSPQSIINRFTDEGMPARFHLVDAFTSGFGKDDPFFTDFYRGQQAEMVSITRVEQPADTEHLIQVMNRLAEGAGARGRYVFDSPTAMLELWGGEERVLEFFSYLCPKLYDLETLAYWITEKHAHSSSFLAKLLHITQVVIDLDVSKEGVGLTVRKAEDRPGCRVGWTHYFASVDQRAAAPYGAREELEMRLLREISRAVGSSLDLDVVFEAVMHILARGLNMRRGTLVLEDPATAALRIVAAHGLTEEEMARGIYRIGEGVTGTVVETGEPLAILDIREDARFLDRTRARGRHRPTGPVAFVCVPLRIEERVIGALSIDRESVGPGELEKDQRLLQIVGSTISQAIKINRMIAVEKDDLLGRAGTQAVPESRYHVGNLVGASPKMQEVLAAAGMIADSSASVLIQGETGTGKELIAHFIHDNGSRAGGPFVTVNCGALPDTLLESELFGHVRGAYTGAVGDRAGRFELADGGTVFLDEVATMSPQLQVRLLRVLQEKTFERVGSSEQVTVDVRVVAATNVKLEDMVERGDFREDLFYRLNVLPIHLPPLRDRREDIPALVEHFIDVFSRENTKQVTHISREVLDMLSAYDWPGNVRELENCIERAVVMSQSGRFTAELLPEPIRRGPRHRPILRGEPAEALEPVIARLRRTEQGNLHNAVIRLVEKSLIQYVLAANDGVQTRTARELGISRNTLRDRMRQYAIRT